jgi:hypothetical protein
MLFKNFLNDRENRSKGREDFPNDSGDWINGLEDFPGRIQSPFWPFCPSFASDFLFTAKWHISGISVFRKKLKIPARNVYEGLKGNVIRL